MGIHLLIFLLLIVPRPQEALPSDSTRVGEIFARAFAEHWSSLPMGGCVAASGRTFIGMPYEAGTLDHFRQERLVINLHSFDCTTFLETSLALARCIKSGRTTFRDYTGELRNIRYRDGSINGYAARLHYIIDWIRDNAAKGLISDVTPGIGGVATKKTINYMTSHRSQYPALAGDSLFTVMRGIERNCSGIRWYRLPASRAKSAQRHIMTGDLIMITTSQAGLDVRHNGIAVRDDGGNVRLLHASETSGTVRISREILPEYLAKHRWATGIIVLRPRDAGR